MLTRAGVIGEIEGYCVEQIVVQCVIAISFSTSKADQGVGSSLPLLANRDQATTDALFSPANQPSSVLPYHAVTALTKVTDNLPYSPITGWDLLTQPYTNDPIPIVILPQLGKSPPLPDARHPLKLPGSDSLVSPVSLQSCFQ